jgi:hypothetical protein
MTKIDSDLTFWCNSSFIIPSDIWIPTLQEYKLLWRILTPALSPWIPTSAWRTTVCDRLILPARINVVLKYILLLPFSRYGLDYMSYKKHELLILIEHQNSLPVFGEVCVFWVPLFCFSFYLSSFCGLCLMLPVSLECPFMIALRFSLVCLPRFIKKITNVHVHALSKRRLSTITKRLVSLSFLCFCFVLWVSCLNSSIDSSVLYSATLSGIQWILLKYYLPNLKDVTKFCSALNILLPKGWFCIKTRAGETMNAIL